MLKSDQTDPAIFQALWQTITQGKIWSYRITSTKKDKTTMQENVTVSPVCNEAGDFANFVTIKCDVTEIDFLQRQLLKAKKLEAIGQMAAGIAHKINIPRQYVRHSKYPTKSACFLDTFQDELPPTSTTSHFSVGSRAPRDDYYEITNTKGSTCPTLI